MAKTAVTTAWIGFSSAVLTALIGAGAVFYNSHSDHSASPVGSATSGSIPSGQPTPSGQTKQSGTDLADTKFVGVVIDGVNNDPISGAAVTLLGEGGDAVTSNSSGSFALTLIQLKGSSMLYVSAAGFTPRSFALDLSADVAKDALIPLQPVHGDKGRLAPREPVALKLDPGARKLMIQGVRPKSPLAFSPKRSWLVADVSKQGQPFSSRRAR